MAGVTTIAVRDGAIGLVGLDLTAGAADAALGELEGDDPTDGVPATALAVLVVQSAAICDCLAAPSTIYQRAGGEGSELVARFPAVTVANPSPESGVPSPDSGVEVGAWTTASALDELNPEATGLSAEERERRVMLFALRRCVRRVPDVWRVAAPADRPAAGWPLLIAAGARVVVALGVAYLAGRALTGVAEVLTSAEERRNTREVMSAGAMFETRFRDWISRGRPPGGMAPPSELERAIADRLRNDARSEWSELFRETAVTVAKWAGIAVAIYFGIRLLTGGKRDG